jgi:hypothetical protein
MDSYKIIGFNPKTHQITLWFDERRVTFPLTIVNGVYPSGNELTTLLNTYVANARLAANMTASNLSDIMALVTPAPPQSIDAQIAIAKQRRTLLLALTDWTQCSDSKLSTDELNAWTVYRQELRDLTNQPFFPTQIIWPIPPVVIRNFVGNQVVDALGNPL